MLGIVLDIDNPALDKTSKAHSFSLIHIFIEDRPCAGMYSPRHFGYNREK